MQYFNRYALNYHTFYCNLQILNDWSVGKKSILFSKKESRKTLGWFSNRTGTSVHNGVRKTNNWLDQWQRMAERQIRHRKSCLVLSTRFPVANWRSGPVAKSAYWDSRETKLVSEGPVICYISPGRRTSLLCVQVYESKTQRVVNIRAERCRKTASTNQSVFLSTSK